MIPKIIHYCWLSGDPYPEKIRKCIDSWKRILPDWEFRLWDKSCLDEIDEVWVHEAYEAKVYSHASDYIRLYAVYKYGGFYLDSDVEVLRDFSPLLSLPYVFGLENVSGNIEAATFGAEPGLRQLKECMKWYHGRHFIKPNGKKDLTTIPGIMMKAFGKVKVVPSIDLFDRECERIQVFPTFFFSPLSYSTYKMTNLTPDTFSIHHFAQSWRPLSGKIAMFVYRSLGKGVYVWLCSWAVKFRKSKK